MNTYDGLTSYCLEGGWEMGEISPLNYVVAYNVPKNRHRINFEGIADDSYKMTMLGSNALATAFYGNAEVVEKNFIASCVKEVIPFWCLNISSFITHLLMRNLKNNKPEIISDIFPIYRQLNGIPKIKSEEELLTATVIDNAISVCFDGYIGDHYRESVDLVKNNNSNSKLVVYNQSDYSVNNVKSKKPIKSVNGGRRFNKAIRKAVVRARDLFDGVVGGKELINGFLVGNEIYIEGTVFDYTIKKTYNVVNNGKRFNVTPYDLRLYCKKSSLELGKLCVYFDDTPIIDQVFGFLMCITAGRAYEEKILTAANIFAITKEGYSSELLRDFFKITRLNGLEFEENLDLSSLTKEQDAINLKSIVNLYIFKKIILDSKVAFGEAALYECFRSIMKNSRFGVVDIDLLNLDSILKVGYKSTKSIN